MEHLQRAGEPGRRDGRHDPDSVGPRRRPRSARRFRACSRRRACIIIWCAKARGRDARCVVETGDAREVHHFALLIGYGAGAVNPYLAFETLDDMIRAAACSTASPHEQGAVHNYIKALNKGILKVMSKMGISTLQSYCGAQIFEAIGLEQAFVDRYFTCTASRIGGVGIDVIARRSAAAARARVPGAAGRRAGSRLGRRVPVAARRRAPPVQPGDRAEAAARDAHRTSTDLRGVHASRQRSEPQRSARCAACSTSSPSAAGAARRGRAGRSDRQAVRDRRDVVRLDQPGSARDARHRDESPRRQVEHRRRRRRSGALQPRRERRLAAQRDQASGVGALRRHQRIPRQRRRAADQDGAGRQARRRRPAARAQGGSRGSRRSGTRRPA